jgi:uncharacterized protein (TIGR00645 family)
MPTEAGPKPERGIAKRLELVLEGVLFHSRWLTAPVYIAFVVLLVVLTIGFVEHLVELIPRVPTMSETELVVAALKLVDLSLIINLVIIIMMAGFENFVSRLHSAEHEDWPDWLGKISFGEMKLKVIGSIIAISGISLLETLLDIEEEKSELILLRVAIFLAFVVGGVLMAWTEKLSNRH